MPKGEHIHTGPIAFLYSGVAAIIVIQLIRLVAARLVDAGHERAGGTLGAIVHFG